MVLFGSCNTKRLFASVDGRTSPKRILRGVPAAIVASGEGYTLGKALEHMASHVIYKAVFSHFPSGLDLVYSWMGMERFSWPRRVRDWAATTVKACWPTVTGVAMDATQMRHGHWRWRSRAQTRAANTANFHSASCVKTTNCVCSLQARASMKPNTGLGFRVVMV